jgi:IS30 family transposase
MEPSRQQDVSVQEISRELARLAQTIESLAQEIKEEFSTLRKEMVRMDVYQANREVEHVVDREMDRRVSSLENRNRALTTAVATMILSVVGGTVIYLLSRGF